MRTRKFCTKWLLLLFFLTSVFYVFPVLLNGFGFQEQDVFEWRIPRRVTSLENDPEVKTKPKSAPTSIDKEDVKTRHLDIRKRCEEMGTQVSQQPPKFQGAPFISDQPRLFFCPMAKAGSTFFTRYFMAIQKDGPMTNPFDIDISQASREKQRSLYSIQPQDQVAFLNTSIKAVFTRNPYARIFSAYIDKFFSPNPYYWGAWGKVAIKINVLNNQDYPCGSGVSFPQFIKAVIREFVRTDLHFIPMDNLCKFCEVGYDVVGKVEHSMTDIAFFSQKLNVSSDFLHAENYKMSSIKDAIRDSTNDALSLWRRQISGCISDYDSGRIIWRKLQIRGFIDAGIIFPFSQDDMKTVTLESFRKECYKAAEESTDSDRLYKQKKIAFQQAYSALADKEIFRLQQIYRRDFILLGYDDTRPDYSISQTIGVESSDSLDWSKPWVLK